MRLPRGREVAQNLSGFFLEFDQRLGALEPSLKAMGLTLEFGDPLESSRDSRRLDSLRG